MAKLETWVIMLISQLKSDNYTKTSNKLRYKSTLEAFMVFLEREGGGTCGMAKVELLMRGFTFSCLSVVSTPCPDQLPVCRRWLYLEKQWLHAADGSLQTDDDDDWTAFILKPPVSNTTEPFEECSRLPAASLCLSIREGAPNAQHCPHRTWWYCNICSSSAEKHSRQN